MSTASRKEDHVNLAATGKVGFRRKTTGLDEIELPYTALPEIDLEEITTKAAFLGRWLSLPLVITGMTGGYPDAERINAGIAEACAEMNIAMGVGSMRAAVEDASARSTFSVVKQYANRIPIIANIGAVQVVHAKRDDRLRELCEDLVDLVGASALAIHLNPLQELLQPEGQPQFKGVLNAIEAAVRVSPVPIIVKEVGAGLSGNVVRRLDRVGVDIVDIAGAGGTSWAGVEISRQERPDDFDEFWDIGIPTAEAIRQCRGLVPMVIASGGIANGTHVAKAIALGANMVGTARPVLQAFMDQGTEGAVKLLTQWHDDLRRWMFITGSQTLHSLANIL